ncbi:MAG: hypothetical protein IJ837_04645 [Clostridia bacterium]|nr:hypothetical protein [Clostridia bacterium]
MSFYGILKNKIEEKSGKTKYEPIQKMSEKQFWVYWDLLGRFYEGIDDSNKEKNMKAIDEILDKIAKEENPVYSARVLWRLSVDSDGKYFTQSINAINNTRKHVGIVLEKGNIPLCRQVKEFKGIKENYGWEFDKSIAEKKRINAEEEERHIEENRRNIKPIKTKKSKFSFTD